MPIQIDKTSRVPLHDQIKEQIKGLIHAGQLKTGDQLPTMRELSIELAVNFNTVAHAYRELDGEGVITTRRGEGTFVASTPGAAEMRRIRQKKLRELINALFNETDRLGYTVEEVKQALDEQINK
ncbi:MAG: GntR family transcriptional regulator [Anaerolineales bacterium]|jgi:GntR family transcriptional regulator|nr:GntR family transcriptional regulator [Anaerolineales bacterium]